MTKLDRLRKCREKQRKTDAAEWYIMHCTCTVYSLISTYTMSARLQSVWKFPTMMQTWVTCDKSKHAGYVITEERHFWFSLLKYKQHWGLSVTLLILTSKRNGTSNKMWIISPQNSLFFPRLCKLRMPLKCQSVFTAPTLTAYWCSAVSSVHDTKGRDMCYSCWAVGPGLVQSGSVGVDHVVCTFSSSFVQHKCHCI